MSIQTHTQIRSFVGRKKPPRDIYTFEIVTPPCPVSLEPSDIVQEKKNTTKGVKSLCCNATQQRTIHFALFYDTTPTYGHIVLLDLCDHSNSQGITKPMNDRGGDGGGTVDRSVGNRRRGGEGGVRPSSSERLDESVQLWRVFSVGSPQRNARRSEQVDDQDQSLLRAPVERPVQLAIVEHHNLAFIVSPKLPHKRINSGTEALLRVGREREAAATTGAASPFFRRQQAA